MCESSPTQAPPHLPSQARGRARADKSVYSFVAIQGSREVRREQTNEALEALMERAVAAVQEMDPAEYQAKVCGQPVHPQTGEGGCGHCAWKGSDADARTHPFLWGLTWPTW